MHSWFAIYTSPVSCLPSLVPDGGPEAVLTANVSCDPGDAYWTALLVVNRCRMMKDQNARYAHHRLSCVRVPVTWYCRRRVLRASLSN
jgi:hypothetical protein